MPPLRSWSIWKLARALKKIPVRTDSGYTSVTASRWVAAGKAYVYVNESKPSKWRMVTKEILNQQGYSPDMPADLSKKVEEARAGAERAALKDDKAVAAWADQWAKANVTKEQAKFRVAAVARLKKGAAAVSLDVLAKVAAVVDRKFDTSEDWQKWLEASGLDAAGQKSAASLAAAGKEPQDSLVCLDAATGKTLWTTPLGVSQSVPWLASNQRIASPLTAILPRATSAAEMLPLS